MGVLIMRIPKKYKRGKVKTLNDLFKWTYDGYGMMCELHPKASKKRRIQNKWRNRFGIGFSLNKDWMGGIIIQETKTRSGCG